MVTRVCWLVHWFVTFVLISRKDVQHIQHLSQVTVTINFLQVKDDDQAQGQNQGQNIPLVVAQSCFKIQ